MIIPLHKYPYVVNRQTHHKLLNKDYSGIYKAFFDKGLAELMANALPAKHDGYQFSVAENPYYLD